MKKIFAIVLALTLVLSLAACGAGGGSEETKVSVFWYDEADVYLSTVRAELNKALDEAGVAYDNQYAGKDQAKQLEQIKTAIAGGTNLLVVNVVTSGDPDIAQSVLDAAGDIPVIFFNRAIGNEGSDVTFLSANATACFIGTDAPEAGHMQGKMVGDYVLANFDTVDLNGDGKITYAMFKGEEGNAEAIARTQFGVEDADLVLTAAGKPALEYFDAQAAQKWQTDPEGAWSAKAAKVSGVNVFLTTMLVHTLAGAMYGYSGFVEGYRSGSIAASTGANYECDAIAACVIGGVSFVGGTGKISGIVLGVFVLRIIFIALTMLGVSSSSLYIIKGAIILCACALDMRKYLVKK